MGLMDFLKHFKSQIYPNTCPFCNKQLDNEKPFCDSCRKAIPSKGICQGTSGGYRCSSCMPYKGKPKYAMLRFKFRSKPQYAKNLAYILALDIKRSYEDIIFDCITYVPMHEKAFKKRGYNQSELLAKELSKILNIPCVDVLKKVKHTRPQHKLTARKRRKNLKGAFKIIDKKLVTNRAILLIDDIITTGTTLGECAKTLQTANPSMIRCETFLATARLY